MVTKKSLSPLSEMPRHKALCGAGSLKPAPGEF
nr:MAG TPA: hypothetical protein [Caudoviricetes sp.]